MIYDITGTELIPGNFGRHCPGNGQHATECCCDECDYLLCCIDPNFETACQTCTDPHCPRRENI